MKVFGILLTFVLVQAILAARKRRETEDDETGYSADAFGTLCVLNCFEQQQRKGVDAPVKKPKPLDNGCDSLDLRQLVDLCQSYHRAGSCIGRCPATQSRVPILDALKHICVDKFQEFQKYTPCFNQECPTIEKECAGTCGGVEEFQDELFAQMADNETETQSRGLSISVLGRRKREKALAGTTPVSVNSKEENTTPDPPDYTDPPQIEGVDMEGSRSGFMQVCKYLGCYVNCSRPTLVKECGREAHELLEFTARMLFNIVLTPFMDSFTNSNITEMIFDGCSDVRFVPRAQQSTSGGSIFLAQSLIIIVTAALIKLLN